MILFGLDIDRPCAAMYRKEELPHLASVLFFFNIGAIYFFFATPAASQSNNKIKHKQQNAKKKTNKTEKNSQQKQNDKTNKLIM